MPICKIETNAVLSEPEQRNAIVALSALISSSLGKPDKYAMVQIETSQKMSFASSLEPCAYCQLISLGLSDESIPELAVLLTEFISEAFSIQYDRIYIRFESPQRGHFAHNGKTFA